MAPFKDNVSRASVLELGRVLAAEVPGFDLSAFERSSLDGLGALELKARIAQVAHSLGASLQGSFEAAAPRVARAVCARDLSMWAAWPAVEWVALDGLEDPEVALDALGAMTGVVSAEFAIRPFIDLHPNATWPRLHQWAASPDEHLRRLVSEGTRPKLPWGKKIPAIDDDPGLGIELIERLRDDESEYVRRSVANHLNDVARLDPDLALATAARWREEGGTHVEAVLRHGLRGLVKRGNSRALALIGADVDAEITGTLHLGTRTVAIGGALPFAVELALTGETPSRAIVDYAVHYVRPSGRASRKVFKLATLDLEPGRPARLERKLKLADVSIRTHHPGTHTIELLVNGRVAASAEFELRTP